MATTRLPAGDTARAAPRAPWLGMSRSWFAVETVVAMALAFGVGLWLTAPLGIAFDDWGNLLWMQEQGLTLDALLTPVFDHLSPGHRLLDWLHLQLGPTDPAPMFALMSAGNALSVGALVLVLVEVHGRRWWLPLVALVPATGAIAIDVVGWLAAAYHQVPAMLASLLAVWQFLRWRDTGRSRHLVASILLLGGGLLFISRTLLAIGVILLLDVLVLPEGGWREGLDRLRTRWPVPLLYLGIAAVYVLLVSETILLRPVAGPGDVLAGIRVGWLTRVVPGLFGLHPPYDPFSQLSADWLLVVAALQVALLVLIGIQVAMTRSTARSAGAFVLVVVVAGIMSVTTRASFVGPVAGASSRYWYETLFYGVLLVTWGIQPRRAARATGAREWPHWSTVPATLALLAVLTTNVVQARVHARDLPQVTAGAWTATLVEEIRARGSVEVVDDVLPEGIGPLTWRLSDIQALFPALAVTGHEQALVVTQAGALAEPDFVTIYRDTGAAFADNALVDVDGGATTSGTGLCTTGAMAFDLLVSPDPDDKRYLRLAIEGGATLVHEVATDPGQFEPPPLGRYDVPPDGGVVTIPLDVWDTGLQTFTVSTDERACITHATLATMTNDSTAS